MIRAIYPKDVPVATFHSYLLGTVAPRPIAFASTVDSEGNVNLSPFSFFNTFSANPPILIFSPARRVRDNTTKHTLENVMQVDEVVINVVNYQIVEQASLASTEYDRGINEFVKAGLTPVPSVLVKPPRVAESPASFECKVKQVIPLGNKGGAGNLVICEVLLAHIKEDVFDSKGQIDQQKIDLVARLGGDWYCRASGNALFEIAKPLQTKGIGVDQLPGHIRESSILTGNNLGKLGNIEHIPTNEQLASVQVPHHSGHPHELAKQLLDQNRIMEAWKVLLND